MAEDPDPHKQGKPKRKRDCHYLGRATSATNCQNSHRAKPDEDESSQQFCQGFIDYQGGLLL
jgi:hypothetical protein